MNRPEIGKTESRLDGFSFVFYSQPLSEGVSVGEGEGEGREAFLSTTAITLMRVKCVNCLCLHELWVIILERVLDASMDNCQG